MEMIKQNVAVPFLNKKQSDLRFELFDWLKNKGLTVNQAISLLDLTASQIKESAESQLL